MSITIPNIIYTLKNDICTGCGICETVCPTAAITTIVKDGRFLPDIEVSKCNNSKGCHRCYDICPGVGVNLISLAKDSFVDDAIRQDKMTGRYLRCYTGYSLNYDIRYHSASGGMVSQFLIWLLDNDKIDGAILTKFDKSNPLLVDSFIATTKEQIVSARSSKYSPVSLHNAIKELKTIKGQRFVIVGLPCHIQGVRKLMEIDRITREKIIGLFAIYCSSSRSFHLTEYVFKKRNIQKENLEYFQYRDEGCLGSMVAKQKGRIGCNFYAENSVSEISFEEGMQVYREPYQGYFHPLRSFFIPRRCNFCIDHYGELGDISFGDIHIKPYSDDKIGVNSLIVRKRCWLDLLEECNKDGVIVLEEVPFETISDSQPMSFKKKGRNGAFINIGKIFGLAVPEYDVDYLRQPTVHDWIDYFQTSLQQFIGNHKLLWPIISLLKSKVNIH